MKHILDNKSSMSDQQFNIRFTNIVTPHETSTRSRHRAFGNDLQPKCDAYGVRKGVEAHFAHVIIAQRLLHLLDRLYNAHKS